jgi:hypothetical protein
MLATESVSRTRTEVLYVEGLICHQMRCGTVQLWLGQVEIVATPNLLQILYCEAKETREVAY